MTNVEWLDLAINDIKKGDWQPAIKKINLVIETLQDELDDASGREDV